MSYCLWIGASDWSNWDGDPYKYELDQKESARGTKSSPKSPTHLLTFPQEQRPSASVPVDPRETSAFSMPAYSLDLIAPHDNIQYARCKLHSLERKCFSKVEKLKLTLEEHLHNGIPASDLLEKTVSFFTMKKAVVLHSGYSRCTRDALRMWPSPNEDVEPLFCRD